MRARRLLAALLIGLAAASGARPAIAAPSKGETLFREGKEAMDKQDFATACKKFQESYDLEHVVNSLLSLANCEEKQSHLARALELWQQGVTESKDEDTRALATDRAAQLRPRVPRLIVHVAQAGLKNAHVLVDGKEVVPDRDVLVDVGDHTIQATADGADPESLTRRAVEGQTTTVTVLGTIAKPVETKPGSDPGATLKIAGLVTGGVGVAGLIVFGATGIAILTDERCGDFDCPKSQRPQGTLVANAVGLVVGIAGLGAGVTLYLVGNAKSKQKSAALHVQPILGGGVVGASVDF